MDLFFSSKEELYKRVKPALKAKKRELDRFGYSYFSEVDIWNYLVKTKWIIAHDLTLSDVVNDIMQAQGNEVDIFLKEQHQKNSQGNDRLEII